MDVQRRYSGLATQLITLHLVLACLASGRTIESDDSNIIHLIHPTMHRAFLLDDGNALLETNTLALIRPINQTIKQLIKFRGGYAPDVATAAKISSSSTNYYPNVGKSSYTPGEYAQLRQNTTAVVRITYESEIDTYKKSYDSLKDPIFGRGSTCNKEAFRALDLVRISKTDTSISERESAIAVGFGDTHLCLLYYQSFDPTRVRDDPFGSATRVVEHRLPVAQELRFRVASATIADRDVTGTLQGIDVLVEYYDEAGQAFQFSIVSPDSEGATVSQSTLIASLTSVNLMENGSKLDYEHKATRDELNESRAGVMRQHFERSFVESVTMFEGGLAYSRGLFHKPQVHFINKTGSSWPLNGEGSPSTLDKTIVAYETFRRNGSRYHHVFDLQLRRAEGHQYMDDQSYYWFCEVPVGEAELQITWPAGSKHCSYTPHEVKRTPIDVVYREQCDKVYAFYQHLVQWESGDKKLTKDSPYAVLEWMRFPLNAILHHKDRLYLFGPANSLRISEPIGSDCTFTKLSVPYEEYYQSDLLFMLSQAAGEEKHPGVPFYDSDRYFDGHTWTPPLGAQKDVPQELLLDAVPRESVSYITILLLLIAAILVLLAVLYVYFTRRGRTEDKRADDGSRVSLRQRKWAGSPIATIRSSGPSRMQRGSPPISDTPTVRSVQDGGVEPAPTVRTSADSAITKPARSSVSTKRRQARVTAPASAGSLSRKPSGTIRSPASGGGSASKTGKSAKTSKVPYSTKH